MIYYSNRCLSHKLSINLAKWKRWVREFLPADPLGGRQSGYARQLNLKDGFKVYLAGHLVSKIKFSIPEAQMILSDLSAWLKQHGFFSLQLVKPADSEPDACRYRMYIIDHPKDGFVYSIRGLSGPDIETHRSGCFETYELTVIGAEQDPLIGSDILGARVVALTNLYDRFCEALQQAG